MVHVKLFEQFIYEMLQSHPIAAVLKKNGFDIIGTDEHESIYAHHVKDPKLLLTLIKRYGWHVAKWSYAENDQITKEGTDEASILAHEHTGGEYAIEIEPIKSQVMDKLDDYFHATPLENVESISKKGIVPKSKNKLYSYPERTFMCDYFGNVENLIPQLSDISGRKYAVIKIRDANKRITIRRDSSGGGYGDFYTTDYIPPSDLSYYNSTSRKFVSYKEWSELDLKSKTVEGDDDDY